MRLLSKEAILILLIILGKGIFAQGISWYRFDSSDVVAKQNDKTTWAKQAFPDIAYTSSGISYVLTVFRDTIKEGSFSLSSVHTDSTKRQAAIIKYDRNHNVVNAFKIAKDDQGAVGLVYYNGYFYVRGRYTNPIHLFNNDSITVPSGGVGIFLMKMDTLGNLIWVRTFKTTSASANTLMYSENLFVHGPNITLTGYAENGNYILGSTTYNWNDQLNSPFILVYDTSGNAIDLKRVRTSASNKSFYANDAATMGDDGTIYMMGKIYGGAKLYTNVDTLDFTGNSFSDNRALVRYKPELKSFYKSKQFFANSTGTNGYRIISKGAYIYVASTILGNTIDFFGTQYNLNGKNAIVFAKLDTTFNIQWQKITYLSNYYPTAIGLDSFGNLYINGPIGDTLAYDNFNIPVKTGVGGLNNLSDLGLLSINALNGALKWYYVYGSDSMDVSFRIACYEDQLWFSNLSLTSKSVYFSNLTFNRSQEWGYTYAIQLRNDQLLNVPGRLSATALTANAIQLNWSDSTEGEEKYIIERSPDGVSGWTVIDSVGTNIVTYINTGLSPTTTYHYRIRAKCVYHTSAPGNVAQATTLAFSTPPASPTNLTTVVVSKNIVLNWTDNSNNETGFKIWRSPVAGGSFSLLDSVASNTSTYTNTNLNPGNYCYKVNAYNPAGASAFSNESCQTLTGIRSSPSAEDIRVFPQPFKEELIIQSTNITFNKIQIMDANGRMVIELNNINSSGTTIDTSKLSRGVYVIRILTATGATYNSSLMKE